MNGQGYNSARVPSLYIQNKGEISTDVGLILTRPPSRVVVRITGGCGNMSAKDAVGMHDVFSAFAGFDGSFIVGGIRMIQKKGGKILPSVTEIPARLRAKCPKAVVLGIVPRTSELKLVPGLGMLVSGPPEADFDSIIHPDQDVCLLVQQSVDTGVEWEAEYRVCLEIVQRLRDFANWQSLLISYNGGSVTKKEILETADRGWPVVLIKDSGRVTNELAEDRNFLQDYPNVFVAEKTSESLRGVLARLGALRISTEGHRNVIPFALGQRSSVC